MTYWTTVKINTSLLLERELIAKMIKPMWKKRTGSVVRRLVGYDRFEGRKAWEALAQLYSVLRM